MVLYPPEGITVQLTRSNFFLRWLQLKNKCIYLNIWAYDYASSQKIVYLCTVLEGSNIN